MTRCTRYDHLNFVNDSKCGHYNCVIYELLHKHTGRPYRGHTEAVVTRSASLLTAVTKRFERHVAAALEGKQSLLYDLIRADGKCAFSYRLLAHYVLPAPPKHLKPADKRMYMKREMAVKEGYWIQKVPLDQRLNKKDEGVQYD
jgi:hypothetical protein